MWGRGRPGPGEQSEGRLCDPIARSSQGENTILAPAQSRCGRDRELSLLVSISAGSRPSRIAFFNYPWCGWQVLGSLFFAVCDLMTVIDDYLVLLPNIWWGFTDFNAVL